MPNKSTPLTKSERTAFITAIQNEDVNTLKKWNKSTHPSWPAEPLPGDYAFWSELDLQDDDAKTSAATSKVPWSLASPLEIALRLDKPGSVAALCEVLKENTFRRGYNILGGGWTSWIALDRKDRESIPWGSEKLFGSLLALCLLNHDWESYRKLILAGFNEEQVNCFLFLGPEKEHMEDPFPRVLQHFGAIHPKFSNEAMEFLKQRADSYSRLQELCESREGLDASAAKAWRAQVKNVLRESPWIDYWPLFVATENREWGLLKQLFQQGGDPNCRYKTGVPGLARVSTALTPKGLQIWLDAGANPIMGFDGDEPYGTEMCPSPLYEMVWERQLKFVRQMVENTRGNVPLQYEREGKVYSPMLALAVSRKASEVVKWLLEKGVSPDACDEQSGKSIRLRP